MNTSNLQLFTLTHKMPPYGFENNGNMHIPIHVGKDNHLDTFVCDVCDNTGDNISNKNNVFLETTGLYWIWKNVKTDVKGQEQYRRRFILTENQILDILNDYDIITFTPMSLNQYSIHSHYDYCHNINDLNRCKDIIINKFKIPVRVVDFIFNNMHIIYPNNSFICKSDIYDSVCDFCFGVLFDYEKELGFVCDADWLFYAKSFNKRVPFNHPELTQEEYQMRIGGYLFERLFTFFIIWKQYKIFSVSPKNMEN